MIGIIGLGQMGTPIARNIIKCGFPVILWNRTREKAEKFSGAKIEIANSLKEMGEKADTIILMLSNNEAVEEVIFGVNGLYNYLKEGTIIVDMSTLSPTYSKTVYERLNDKKVIYMDAPVIGSVAQAEKAELTILVGGKLDTFNKVLYLFKCLGKNIYYIGPNGSGLAMKMVNNIILGGNLAILSEALNFGESYGLNKKLMFEILATGTASSKIMELKMDKIIENDFSPAFKIEHEEKDLHYAIEESIKNMTPMPVTSIIHELYKIGTIKNQGEDISSIFLVFKNLSEKK